MPTLDPTTGVADRATFDVDLERMAQTAISGSAPLGLVMVDVDKFKRINDTKGHPFGDAVLREVGARLRTTVEGKGTACRYGGEEFAILLPNHDVTETTAIAERVRRTMAGSDIQGIAVTVSCGVAAIPEHATDQVELVKHADLALYDAKNWGRNLVRIFGEAAPTAPGPREPERRAAVSGGLTEHQREAIRLAHFQGYTARCPHDDTVLVVHEMQILAEPTPRLSLNCKLCGLSESI